MLAKAIVEDLEGGLCVALGFEAPMWLPVLHTPRPGLVTFGPRFEAERGSEWYLQSGAAATLKAISLGIMLFSGIITRRAGLRFSTARSDDGSILLYEAFVAGAYKVEPPDPVAHSAANEWDALTAAIAWGGLHEGLAVPAPLRAVELHECGSRRNDAVSVWSVIGGHLATPIRIEGPTDCHVVGLETLVGTA